jgi:integrase
MSHLPSPVQSALIQIAGNATVSRALDECARLVDAANAMELPGLIAAYLRGRVQSVALPILDAVRVARGQAPLRGEVQATQAETSQAVDDVGRPLKVIARRGDRAIETAVRIQAANDMLSQLRNRLQEYSEANPRGDEDTDVRRDLRRDIARLARTATAAVPPIATYLTLWTEHLLEKRPGKPRFLKPSSIQRYLTALSPRFVSLAHDVDLAELDTDDLTELYATITEEVDDDGGQDYVYERLREFHAFAKQRFGLEDPDWSEISSDSPAVSGAPGFILEPEYEFALRQLVPHVDSASRDDLNAAALLLFAYRFGLRGKEAWGLKRDDWIEEANTSVVLVRSNALRALKRRTSQRQVPLLMCLTKLELEILERWKSTREALTSSVAPSSSAFLFLTEDGAMASLRSLRTRVNRALRAATLASHTTLHHARHTFASVAFLALVPSPAAPLHRVEVLDSGHVRKLLLGGERSTRRTAWALARLLGHAHPRTTFKSYVHFLAERTAQTLTTTLGASLHCERTYAGRNLDTVAVDGSYLKRIAPVQVVPPRQPTLVDLVNSARLLAIGQASTSIAHALHVEERVIEHLKQALGDVASRLQRTPRGPLNRGRQNHGRRGTNKSSEVTESLLAKAATEPLERRILVKNWKGLLGIAETAQPPTTLPQAPEPATLIGASLQLLMWEEAHFQSVATFLESLGLRADVVVYESKALPAQMREWAERSGFSERLDPLQDDATRRFQLDGVTDESTGHRFLQRCAVVRRRDGRLNSNAELLLLWTCFLIFICHHY